MPNFQKGSPRFAVEAGFVPILVLIGVIILVTLGFLAFKNYSIKPSILPSDKSNPTQFPKPTTISTTNLNPTTTNLPTPTLIISERNIHLYPFYGTDPGISINKLNIIGVIFVPKNITKQIKPEWPTNMDKIFARIKNFYQKQFENNIEITYQVNATPIKGEKNIEDYYPDDFVQEIEDKNQNLLKSNTHNVWMIYLVEDPNFKLLVRGGGNLGGLARLNASTQGEFWLDDEAVVTGTYGITGSAHEFGHALGIPHPWDLPININHDPNFGNVPGDIIGYSSYPDLDKNYIRDDIKKAMGL